MRRLEGEKIGIGEEESGIRKWEIGKRTEVGGRKTEVGDRKRLASLAVGRKEDTGKRPARRLPCHSFSDGRSVWREIEDRK